MDMIISFIIIIYSFFYFNITFIIVYGSIFNSIRPTKGKFGELFKCPLCVGFWVGVFLLGISGLTELFNFEYNLINALLLGWLSSGTSYVLSTLFNDNGLKVNFGG